MFQQNWEKYTEYGLVDKAPDSQKPSFWAPGVIEYLWTWADHLMFYNLTGTCLLFHSCSEGQRRRFVWKVLYTP